MKLTANHPYTEICQFLCIFYSSILHKKQKTRTKWHGDQIRIFDGNVSEYKKALSDASFISLSLSLSILSAMFASSLSLGLVFLPFVFAVVHDVMVGAGGELQYSPEAIVRICRQLFAFLSSVLSVCRSW